MKLISILLAFFLTIHVQGQNCESSILNNNRIYGCNTKYFFSADRQSVYHISDSKVKKWDLISKKVTAAWSTNNSTLYTTQERFIFLTQKEILDTKNDQILPYQSGYQLQGFSPDQLEMITPERENNQLYKIIVRDIETGKKKKVITDDAIRCITSYDGNITAITTLGNQNKMELIIYNHSLGQKIFTKKLYNIDGDMSISKYGKYLRIGERLINTQTGQMNRINMGKENISFKKQYIFSDDENSIWVAEFGTVFSTGRPSTSYCNSIKKFNVLDGEIIAAAYSMKDSFKDNFFDFFAFQFTKSESPILYSVFSDKVQVSNLPTINKFIDSLILPSPTYQIIAATESTPVALDSAQLATAEKIKVLRAEALDALSIPVNAKITFSSDNDIALHTEAVDQNHAIIGNGQETGIFSFPGCELVRAFTNQPSRITIGDADKMVLTQVAPYRVHITPDAKYSVVTNGLTSEFFEGNKSIKYINDFSVFALISNELCVEFDVASKKIHMYNFLTEKRVATYGDYAAGLNDQLKISFSKNYLVTLTIDDKYRTQIYAYEARTGKRIYDKKINKGRYYIAGITDNHLFVFNSENMLEKIDLQNGQVIETKAIKNKSKISFSTISNNHLITIRENGLSDIFSFEKMDFIETSGMYTIEGSSTNDIAYFPEANELFRMSKTKIPLFSASNNSSVGATGYIVNSSTSAFTPVLLHKSKTNATAIVQANQQQFQDDPSILQLLRSLALIQPSYQLNYSNFNFIDLMNFGVMQKYFGTLAAGDRIMGIGKFCYQIGMGNKILALAIKKGVSSEQYNIMLISMNNTKITGVEVIGTTQKVNGQTTQVADLTITKSAGTYRLEVKTSSSRFNNTKIFTAPGNCQ